MKKLVLVSIAAFAFACGGGTPDPVTAEGAGDDGEQAAPTETTTEEAPAEEAAE
ncbi:MAG: hypothetical protein FWD57_08555 [Polyangiaceae bacterium]|nr:hypothetical protein [Polyangiaceae bacterium]